MLIVELACVRVRKERGKQPRMKNVYIFSLSTSAGYSFLPSPLYCLRGVAGNDFFGFPSDPMQRRRQEHVGRMK